MFNAATALQEEAGGLAAEMLEAGPDDIVSSEDGQGLCVRVTPGVAFVFDGLVRPRTVRAGHSDFRGWLPG